MKTATRISRIANWLTAGVLLFGVSAAATAQIKDTRHNLGASNAIVGANKTNDVAEVCVFCHTPHGADVTTVGAPLWNKRLTTGATYNVYSSSTMEAAKATDGVGGGSIGSVSLPCLSCHDGTQAMDNILNSPGSGGYAADGGLAAGQSFTWAVTGRADASGKLLGIANLGDATGGDLSNDHPIGIQYCGGGPGAASAAAGCVDPAFVTPSNSGGASPVFWVNTIVANGGTGVATKEKTDMILFNRTFAAGTFPSVECATCHDPHSATNATFLRVSNAGSGVCLSCHIK